MKHTVRAFNYITNQLITEIKDKDLQYNFTQGGNTVIKNKEYKVEAFIEDVKHNTITTTVFLIPKN